MYPKSSRSFAGSLFAVGGGGAGGSASSPREPPLQCTFLKQTLGVGQHIVASKVERTRGAVGVVLLYLPVTCITQDNTPTQDRASKLGCSASKKSVGPEHGVVGKISSTASRKRIVWYGNRYLARSNRALNPGPGGVLSCVTCGMREKHRGDDWRHHCCAFLHA